MQQTFHVSSLQDSAAWYYNEKQCGDAIRAFLSKTGLPRESIFFTTKLRHNSTYQSVQSAIDKSIADCGLGYIDLYLLHSPIGGPEARRESWRAVCDAKKEGKLRSIGVSNFGVAHINEMIDSGVELPAINQVSAVASSTPTPRICVYTNRALGRLAPVYDSY